MTNFVDFESLSIEVFQLTLVPSASIKYYTLNHQAGLLKERIAQCGLAHLQTSILLQQFISITALIHKDGNNWFASEHAHGAHSQQHGIGFLFIVHGQHNPILIQVDGIDGNFS